MKSGAGLKATLTLLSMLIALPVSAQMVIQATSASLQPQIRRDEQGFLSCGVRAIVSDLGQKFAEFYDFSVHVDAVLLLGALKAGKTRTLRASLMKGNVSTEAVIPSPINFWIAKEAEGKAVTPLKIMAAESKGFILAVADFVASYDVIEAMIHGERVQFAVRYKDQPLDVVVSFSANMPEVERTPLLTCLESVAQRAAKLAEDK